MKNGYFLIQKDIGMLIIYQKYQEADFVLFYISYDLHIVSMQLFVIVFNVVYSRNQELTFQPHFVQNL